MDVNEQQDEGMMRQAEAKIQQAPEKAEKVGRAATEKIETGVSAIEQKMRKAGAAVATGASVIKGVATGLTDQLQKEDLAGSAKAAAQGTGNVVREVGQTGAEEMKQVKDTMRGGSS